MTAVSETAYITYYSKILAMSRYVAPYVVRLVADGRIDRCWWPVYAGAGVLMFPDIAQMF